MRKSGPTPSLGGGESRIRLQGRAIDLFHIAYCQVAAARLPLDDFALKGGGNLRFFLRSPRRSADLDLDFLGRDFDRFASAMDALLTSRTLAELLRMREIELLFEGRRAKDTATVKRWKFQLARGGMDTASSKIEFSARRAAETPVLEQMDTDLARRLGGVAARLQHYPPRAAIEQKVRALADRNATEPRDVFDLDHLLRAYPEALAAARPDRERVRAAKDRAIHISYDEYKDLVVDFLEEDFVDMYGTKDAWEDMVLRVDAALELKLGESK